MKRRTLLLIGVVAALAVSLLGLTPTIGILGDPASSARPSFEQQVTWIIGEEAPVQQPESSDRAVPFDVKPGSCRNPLNVQSQGVLPVAILGIDGFDVTDIDPESVRVEGVAPLRWSVEDVATPFEPFTGKEDAFDCTEEGPDGFDDLTLKFSRQDVIAAVGEVEDGDVVVFGLTGELFDGTPFEGEEVVVILKKGRD